MRERPATPMNLKAKDMLGIPWRLAFALQEDGWYLRSEIIWNKPNAQPESVKDRPSRSHEYIFMFTKSSSYKYKYENSLEKAETSHRLRNRRTVWSVSTGQKSRSQHMAPFPKGLIEPLISMSTDPHDIIMDPFAGSGTVLEVAHACERRFIGIELSKVYWRDCCELLKPARPEIIHLAGAKKGR
jgi:DNA modification methylase